MPVIGITASKKIEDYRQSILHVGGEVRVLDPTTPAADALVGLDGLLLTGGEDVAPERYGEARHPSVVDVNDARDEFELALIKAARERDLPILAICRGIQILNVACGGSLVQDIPSQVPGASEHQFKIPPHQPFTLAHEVWLLDRETRLGRLMREQLSDTDAAKVNSRHHQAIGRVAAGFLVSATAPDGIIEAIEDPGARFCLGLQWHPENFWRTGEFRPVFEALVAAAEARS